MVMQLNCLLYKAFAKIVVYLLAFVTKNLRVRLDTSKVWKRLKTSFHLICGFSGEFKELKFGSSVLMTGTGVYTYSLRGGGSGRGLI